MGSYNEILVGQGRTRQEAKANAWDAYVHENGHRCSLRGEISAELVRYLPPKKWVTVQEQCRDHFGRRRTIDVTHQVADTQARQSEWLQEWKFEVWVHS